MSISIEERIKNPVCRQCIKEHLERYDGFVDEDGTQHKGFTIPCTGIPLEYLSPHLRAVLDEDAVKDAIALFDPVTWAEEWIKLSDGTPWIARWYQKHMLRCTATRRVTRCGRRVGKTDVLSVDILHYCFNNKNKKVLVVAPYKSQTEEIISRVRGFIATNPKLVASVKRDVSAPFYEIKFHNGSRIRGFSSGTKSGSEGVAIRGQDADRIYLDEADYLSDGDLKAIVAILNTHAHVQMWASSTPTGRRANFWRWSTKTPSYKEFYYPSMVLPFWDEVKTQIKADYIGNHDAWVHEILAEFGEQTVGVFQHKFIDNAIGDYRYETLKREPGWIYSIGVDWNSDHGTEIAVVGYDKRGRFKVVDAVNIARQDWTQLKGIQAIINMNALWLPEFIYVDDGGGTTNVELLRKHGFDTMAYDRTDPACKLKNIVHKYNFSSKIDVRDPLTKRPIKKHAKPFLVENTVRFFEESRIQISAWDMVLRNQLGNYIIKHRSVAGIPVYGVTEERVADHRLDALMLALIAFKLQMSDFGRIRYDNHVAVSPGFSRLRLDIEHKLDPDKEAERRINQAPQPRFEDNERVIAIAGRQMPGKIENGEKPAVYRHGFMTDEEEKLQRRYMLRNAKRRARVRKRLPQRTTF